MSKRKQRKILKTIEPVSYWYFLIATLISASVAAWALRDNNLTALRLHNDLISVDKSSGDVNTALNNLRQFTYAHMNTNLSSGPGTIYPPIQLQYTYQRLVSAEQARADAVNKQVYTDAESYCQNLIPTGFSGRGRVPCIESYVTSHGTKAQPIPAALYEFDFVSPFWSPDLAGWAILTSIILFICFIVRFVLEKWLKHNLKQH